MCAANWKRLIATLHIQLYCHNNNKDIIINKSTAEIIGGCTRKIENVCAAASGACIENNNSRCSWLVNESEPHCRSSSVWPYLWRVCIPCTTKSLPNWRARHHNHKSLNHWITKSSTDQNSNTQYHSRLAAQFWNFYSIFFFFFDLWFRFAADCRRQFTGAHQTPHTINVNKSANGIVPIRFCFNSVDSLNVSSKSSWALIA